MNNPSLLTLEFHEKDTSRGSCNFCNNFSQSRIFEAGGNGVTVRFCEMCMDKLISTRENIMKKYEIKELLHLK